MAARRDHRRVIAPRPRRLASCAAPRGDHGVPVGLSRRGPSRHHDRARPARVGARPVAAGAAARRRRSAPLAGGRRRGAGSASRTRTRCCSSAAGLAAGLLVARRWDVRSLTVGVGRRRARAPPLGARTSPGRRPTAGRSSRWRARSPRTRPTTVPRSCRSLWLFPGPLLFPVSAAGLGLGALRGRGERHGVRSGSPPSSRSPSSSSRGGKAYYAIGSVAVFMAAGAIVLDRWLGAGPRRREARRLRRRRGPLGRAHRAADAADPAARRPTPRARCQRRSPTPPTRSAGRSSSRPSRGSSTPCPRTSAPTR